MSDEVKICSECGEEYRLDATACADCGGELEVRPLDDDGRVVPGVVPAPAETEIALRAIFMTPQAADLVPLYEALEAASIPYRMAEQPAQTEGALPRYALFVPDGEAENALRTLGPLLAEGHDGTLLTDVESRFAPDRGYVQCPACGAEQPPGAAECAACGLGLGRGAEGGVSCPRCAAPMPDAETTCPSCGHAPE